MINPYTAVASARAHPKSNALVILPSASGCLAIASTAYAVALPIPSPAPIPVNTAIPAPIATKSVDDIILSPFLLKILIILILSLP